MLLLNRMLRAMKLESAIYEEVEHDATATSQAMLVVVIANLLFGIGLIAFHFTVTLLIGRILGALLGWCAWAVMTYFLGTKLFGGKATIGEMLRVLGFATTPLCLGVIPFVGGAVGFIWWMVAMVIAVRQGLDVSTGKAIATILIGLAAYIAVAVAISMAMGAGASLATI